MTRTGVMEDIVEFKDCSCGVSVGPSLRIPDELFTTAPDEV